MRKIIKGGDVNFSSYPDTFPSSDGAIPGVGFSGTKNNILAANGTFSQNGGYYGFSNPIGNSFGKSGHGTIQVNEQDNSIRPMNNFSKKISGGRRYRFKKKGRKFTNKRKRKTAKYRTTKHRRYRTSKINKRGGNGQPYNNIPISFSQTFNKSLSPENSALATPTPLSPVSNYPYM